MSAETQKLIDEVRAKLKAQDYAAADQLLRQSDAQRASWTQQERDEVLCLEEFVRNLASPLRY